MTTMCEKDGVHRLPEGEESWRSERCDTLVAAGLDKCAQCQERLIGELSATLTDDFGKLFTTWVLNTLRLRDALGASIPDTALELFGPNGGTAISPASRRALRRVRLPRFGMVDTSVGAAVSVDAAGATSVLVAMKASEREAVLNDAMDGIVMSIAVG